jgi:hypothetical protein
MTEHALILRATVIGGERLENDYCVFREERSIGRIREATERAGFSPGWVWSINVPLPIPPWGNGFSPSLEAAKVAFREAWVRFYETLTPHDIQHWHHHQDAAAERFRSAAP